MKQKLLVVLLLIFIYSCNKAKRKEITKPSSPIEYAMDNSAKLILENPEINAISIGVYKDGETFKKYYGEIDKGKSNKANDNTLFEIASVTKTFTAYITAKAVLEGKLNLETDIRSYLDDSYNNLIFQETPILVKNLVTHTSGVKREDFSEILAKMFSETITKKELQKITSYSRNDFSNDLKKYKLTTKPGKTYDYSGFVGPEILALLLEKVYQKPYKQLIQDYILDKVDMANTYLEVNPEDKQHLINGYSEKQELVTKIQLPLTGAGGGLKSTVPDMLMYIEFLLNKDNPIVNEMRKPLFYDESEGDEYGYFWMLDGDNLMLHNGGTNGSLNWLVLLPKLNTGFTISFNTNGDKANDLINTLASLLINDLVNYPVKNAYYLIKEFINKSPNNWQSEYYKLKKERPEEYNFNDSDLLNNLGYELLQEKKTTKAIEVFKLLVVEFPESANAYDSLGECYFMNHQYKLALKNYQKSLALNAKNTNAKEMIEKIKQQWK